MSIINPLLLPSHHVATAAVIDPVSQTPGGVQSGWVNMAEFSSIMAQLQIGTMSASSTVDAKLTQATNASGAGAKDIAGKAITQLTQAGGDSDKQVKINLHNSELDTNNNYTHARLEVTVAGAASLLSAEVQGHSARYGPANVRNAQSVAQIVN